MTKEEYKAEHKRLSDIIHESKEQLKKMEGEFIDEHCPYNGGDKIKIVVGYKSNPENASTYTGFVRGCWVNLDGELQYSLRKEKKDGSESSHRLTYYGSVLSSELIEKAKP